MGGKKVKKIEKKTNCFRNQVEQLKPILNVNKSSNWTLHWSKSDHRTWKRDFLARKRRMKFAENRSKKYFLPFPLKHPHPNPPALLLRHVTFRTPLVFVDESCACWGALPFIQKSWKTGQFKNRFTGSRIFARGLRSLLEIWTQVVASDGQYFE